MSGEGGQRQTPARRGHTQPCRVRGRVPGSRGRGPALVAQEARSAPVHLWEPVRACACTHVPVCGVCARASRGLCASPASGGPDPHPSAQQGLGPHLDQQNVAEEEPPHLGGLGLCASRCLSWKPVCHPGRSCRSVLEGERPREVGKGHPCPARARPARGCHGEPADLLRITRILCPLKPPTSSSDWSRPSSRCPQSRPVRRPPHLAETHLFTTLTPTPSGARGRAP